VTDGSLPADNITHPPAAHSGSVSAERACYEAATLRPHKSPPVRPEEREAGRRLIQAQVLTRPETVVDARHRIREALESSAGRKRRHVMPKKSLRKILFGETPDLQQKQIRQFSVAVGVVLLVCAIAVVWAYLSTRRGH